MTHKIAARNTEVKPNRAPAKRLARQIGLLSRHWVDAEFAGMEMELSGQRGATDRRFSVVKSFLVNILGLKMFLDRRFNDKRHPLLFHHLPVQDDATIEAAIALLTDYELDQGVGDAIRELGHRSHPYACGDVPRKQEGTYTKAEANDAGLVKVNRDHEDNVLAWISKEWVTVAMWDRLRHELDDHGDTRLAAHILNLKDRGFVICTERIRHDGPSKRKFARYRHFTNEADLAEWCEKQRVQAAQKAGDEKKRKNASIQAKLDSAAASYDAIERKNEAKLTKIRTGARRSIANRKVKTALSGGSQYGGWKSNGVGPTATSAPLLRQATTFNAAIKPLVPSAPPAQVYSRLASIQSGYGAPPRQTAPISGAKPPVVEIASGVGIPAAELNIKHPNAKSKVEVDFGGSRYLRRFVATKVGGNIVRWNTFWERV